MEEEKTGVDKFIRPLLFIGIIITMFILMYLLNKFTHFTSDDYRYHYIYEGGMPTNDLKRVESISDLIRSMYNHYHIWGGRITAHSLVQIFLMWGKEIFNVLNAIAYVALGIVMYLHCQGFKKLRVIPLAGIFLLMWFFIPEFGLSVLWVSGACNYLWCTLIILLFLLPYRVYIESRGEGGDNSINMGIMFFGGIVAGWTNENTGGAMILLIIIFIGYCLFNKIKLHKWCISGLIGSIIGFGFLVVAPGNYARAGEAINLGIVEQLQQLMVRGKGIISTSSDVVFGLSIILVMGLSILICQEHNKEKYSIIPIIYLFSAIAGIGALLLSPEAPARAWFGPMCFIIIAIGLIYVELDFNKMAKCITLSCMILLSVSFGYAYLAAYTDIRSTYNHVHQQLEILELEKQKGNKNIIIRRFPQPESKYNAFNGTNNLHTGSDSSGSWFNSWMAKYYEVDSISGVEWDE